MMFIVPDMNIFETFNMKLDLVKKDRFLQEALCWIRQAAQHNIRLISNLVGTRNISAVN